MRSRGIVPTVSDPPRTGRPKGWLGKSRQLKVIENAVVRRIVRLANFLDDNGTFAFELFVKNRMLQNVGEQIEREFGVFFKTFA